MRPYTHHQDELSRFTVRGLREIDNRLDDLTLDTQAQIARLQALVHRSEAAISTELTLLVEGMRARPASTHPAISQTDEHGRRVLRFDGAVERRRHVPRLRGHLPRRRARGAPAAARATCRSSRAPSGCSTSAAAAASSSTRSSPAASARAGGHGRVDGRALLEKGHDVQLADAATYLRGLDDASVPGMFAAQVVEHLSAEELTELLGAHAAQAGARRRAIMETVNPHNPAALKAFWTDTTHHHPLFPEVLLALCRLAGFESGEVRFPEESGTSTPTSTPTATTR